MFSRLSANCPECDKGLINPSLPLVITGLCLTCPLDNTQITYTWEIFHVDVGDSKLVAKEECKPALEDGDQNSRMLSSDVSITSKPSPSTLPLQSQTTAQQSTVHMTLARPTNYPVTSRTVKATNTQTSRAKFASGSICRDSDQIVGPTMGPGSKSSTRRRRPAASGSGSGSGSGGCCHGHGSGSGSGGGGVGGGGFKPDFGAGARSKSTVSTTTSRQIFTTKAPVNNNSHYGDDPAKIYMPWYTPGSAMHSGSIITLKRDKLKLLETNTATGLRSQNFVLLDKYKYFIGGRTYMVAFRVSDGRTLQQGKATVYFNTSNIPECGVCTVTPSAGVAMETMFQLTCSKWGAVVRFWQAFPRESLICTYLHCKLQAKFFFPFDFWPKCKVHKPCITQKKNEVS